jgi:hypothetical protein
MRSPYIASLVIISVCFAGFEEWLCEHAMALADIGLGIIEFDIPSALPMKYLFFLKVLPTVLFISYGILWQVTDYNVRRLEPFYQLARRGGCSASSSICLDYLTLPVFAVPFRSFKHRQWAVFVASIAVLFAGTIAPTVQAATLIFLNPTYGPKYSLRASPFWSRIYSCSQSIPAVCGLILLVQLRRRNTGLLRDPRGVAGLVALVAESDIADEFEALDTATNITIEKRLRHSRYSLQNSCIRSTEILDRHDDSDSLRHQNEHPYPLMLRLWPGMAFLSLMGSVLVADVLMALHLSFTVQVPWLPILLSLLIRIFWASLEYSVRQLEPYCLIARGNADSMALSMDYRGTPYLWLPVKALISRNFVLMFMGVGSILIDILTFLMADYAGLVPAYDVTRASSNKITSSAAIIVFLMIVAAVVYHRYHFSGLKRKHPFLPRQPNSIASIIAFIHESKLLKDLKGTQRSTTREIKQKLQGKKYSLGWFLGPVGSVRKQERVYCAIDEEPRLGKYIHRDHIAVTRTLHMRAPSEV